MALTYAHKAQQRGNLQSGMMNALLHAKAGDRCWNAKGSKTKAVAAFAEDVRKFWEGEGQPAASTVVSLVNDTRELAIRLANAYHAAALAKYPAHGSQDSDEDMTAPTTSIITYEQYKVIDDPSTNIGVLIAEGDVGGEGFVTFSSVKIDLQKDLKFTVAEIVAMDANGYDGRNSQQVLQSLTRKLLAIGLSELEAGNMTKDDMKEAKVDLKRKQADKDAEAEGSALRIAPKAAAAAGPAGADPAGGADPLPPKKKKVKPSSDPLPSDPLDTALMQVGSMFSPEAQEQQHKRNIELAQAANAPMMAMFQLLMGGGGGGVGAAGVAPPQVFAAAPPQPLAHLRACPQCSSLQPGRFCSACGTALG